MAAAFVYHCASNQRCGACSIERLQDPESRVLAGEVVRLSRQDVGDFAGEASELTVGGLKEIVEKSSDMLGRPDLAAVALGAITIGISGMCETSPDRGEGDAQTGVQTAVGG